MFKKIFTYVTALNRLAAFAAGIGVLTMMVLVTVDVVGRKWFNTPLIFATEVTGYLMVFVTFLAVSYALAEGSHIRIEFIIELVNPRGRTILMLIATILGIIYTSVLLYSTSQVAWESYELKYFSEASTRLPLFPFQIVMPIGCLLLLFQLIVEMVKNLQLLLVPTTITEKE
jgi:TRAP-type C4-dicarboxylate transport system permease small subunit